MKWVYVRAFIRELPFLLFRTFEVAIVLSLLCLMFKGAWWGLVPLACPVCCGM